MLDRCMGLEPAKLTDFKLAAALGSGATARVYEATHIATGRPVAIKVMVEAGQGPEMRERFAREALLLAGVESRHVSKILGFGFDKGQPFLVLERLHGETLDAKLRRDGPVPPATAVGWIEQLIVGVRDCHDKKVIHRDIKPGNIFLHRDPEGGPETVKLIDFGVARLREPTDEGGGLTSTSHVLGSMGYMAPEQFQSAKSVGYPADLYAVGVVVFRTLTGRLPFVSRSLEAIIRMKSEQPVPPISSMPGMVHNPLLDWFVQKATVRDPAARFQSAREMLEQWWNVMASLDDEGSTDVMRGFGRVDESYAGRRPEARAPVPLPSQVARPGARTSAPPPTVRLGGQAEHDEDQTLPRQPRAPGLRASSRAASSRPASSRTDPGAPPEEPVPLTVPSADVAAPAAADDPAPPTEAVPRVDEDDPYELPTRSDPTLRKLVERELELHRARRRDRG